MAIWVQIISILSAFLIILVALLMAWFEDPLKLKKNRKRLFGRRNLKSTQVIGFSKSRGFERYVIEKLMSDAAVYGADLAKIRRGIREELASEIELFLEDRLFNQTND